MLSQKAYIIIHYHQCLYFNRQYAFKINAQKQDPGIEVWSVTSRLGAHT